MKLDEIKKIFTSENNYKTSKQLKDLIIDNDKQIIQETILAVKETLQDFKSQPIQKVLSIRLVKEIMDFHIPLVIDKISNELIPIYEKILNGHCEKGQNAKYYFSTQPDEQLMVLGNTFIRLISECIFVWNIWHPYIDDQQSSFSKVYGNLLNKGMQFPKLFYFNSQKVKEFYILTKEAVHQQISPFVHSNNIQPDFFYIKKRLDSNQYSKADIITIRNELLSLLNSNLNQSQRKFLTNFEQAFRDFEKTQKFDEFQITVQSICLEFDDEVFDKQAAIDAFQKRQMSNQSNFTPSKYQGGGYSTDKISQFLSNGSMSKQSQGSIQNDQNQQLQILNEKNRRIEQLLLENSLLQKQIKNFEEQIKNLKQSNSHEY